MALLFRDTFTEASSVTLASHTPDTGTSWTLLIQTTAGVGFNVGEDGNYAQSAASSASNGALYTADTTYTSANYEVSVKVSGVVETSDDTYILAARVQDSANMYAVWFSTAGWRIAKKVLNSWTLLGTGSTVLSLQSGDIAQLIVNSTTIEFRLNGVLVETVSDGDISAAGKAGVGLGAIIVSTHDSDFQEVDDFRVHTLGSGAETETLRPDSAGDLTQLTPSTGSNFENVDEASTDDDTTYNKAPSGGFATRADLYNLPASSIGGGTIDKVIVTARSKRLSVDANDISSPILKVDSLEFRGREADPTTSYTDQTQVFYHNPADGTVWESADISALQIGVGYSSNNLADDDLRTTQVYVTTTYAGATTSTSTSTSTTTSSSTSTTTSTTSTSTSTSTSSTTSTSTSSTTSTTTSTSTSSTTSTSTSTTTSTTTTSTSTTTSSTTSTSTSSTTSSTTSTTTSSSTSTTTSTTTTSTSTSTSSSTTTSTSTSTTTTSTSTSTSTTSSTSTSTSTTMTGTSTSTSTTTTSTSTSTSSTTSTSSSTTTSTSTSSTTSTTTSTSTSTSTSTTTTSTSTSTSSTTSSTTSTSTSSTTSTTTSTSTSTTTTVPPTTTSTSTTTTTSTTTSTTTTPSQFYQPEFFVGTTRPGLKQKTTRPLFTARFSHPSLERRD